MNDLINKYPNRQELYKKSVFNLFSRAKKVINRIKNIKTVI